MIKQLRSQFTHFMSSSNFKTAQRDAQLGTANTSELRDHYIVFATQEAHTSLKAHHELNIWQKKSPLKMRVLQPRLVQQIAKQVSIKIKALMQMVNMTN
jgi:hypothetical protein